MAEKVEASTHGGKTVNFVSHRILVFILRYVENPRNKLKMEHIRFAL